MTKIASSLAAALLTGVAVAFAVDVVDGEWAVELVTTSGPCRPTYSHTVQIRDRRISGRVEGRTGTYAIDGTVSGDGQIEWRTSGGPDPGLFRATMGGDQGHGEWSTGACRGRLSIRRQ